MTGRLDALERRRVRPTGRAGLLVVVVVMLGVVSMVPVREYLNQRAEIRELEERATRLERANDSLRSDIHSLHDDAYLERLARACLGMVERGEIAFVSKASGTDPAC